MQVAAPMTATSKQEPPISTEEPVAEVVAGEPVGAESAAKGKQSGGAASVQARVNEPAAAPEPAAASSEPAAASSQPAAASVEPPAKAAKAKPAVQPNNVRKLRQAAMMSKAELARRAGVSPLTIDRVESGCPCRMDTKRKILEALGLKPEAREQVFGPDIDQG